MFGPIKFNIVVECTYIKPVINETQDRSFKTKNIPIIDNDNLNMTINNAIRDICYDKDIYVYGKRFRMESSPYRRDFITYKSI